MISKPYLYSLLLFGMSHIQSQAQGPLAPSGGPSPTMKSLDQIEPRTPISGPTVLSVPGSYYLTANITVATGTAITVSADNVTLDLSGFTISSTSGTTSGYGIFLSGGRSQIAISNGHIKSGVTYTSGTFSNSGFISGIDYSGTPKNVRISNISVQGVRNYGIDLGTDTSTSVTNSTVRTAQIYGIRAGVVSDSSASEIGNTAIIGTTVANSLGFQATGGRSITSTEPTIADLQAKLNALEANNGLLTGLLGVAGVNFTWNIQTLESTQMDGEYTSLAFGPDGQPAISYFDATNSSLKLATFNRSSWVISTVDSTGAIENTSLVFGPDGYAAIAYFSATASDLKFARYNGSAWTISTIDSTGDVGRYASLAFGQDGQPAIAYYDSTNADLKFARFNGSAWTLSIVDSAGSVGEYASLAFRPDGQPAISYHDATNSDLKFARFNGVTWINTTVDSAGIVGRHTSLAFGADGQPAISYLDATNKDLKFALYDGNSWSSSTVDSSGSVGIYSSLAFGPDGQPCIAYLDDFNYDLKFARYTGTAWNPSTIDKLADSIVGGYASLAFGPDGQPAIAYQDFTHDNVKFARKGIFKPAP